MGVIVTRELVNQSPKEKQEKTGFNLCGEELCDSLGWMPQHVYDLKRRKLKEGEHYIEEEYRRSGKVHKRLRFNIDAIFNTFKMILVSYLP